MGGNAVSNVTYALGQSDDGVFSALFKDMVAESNLFWGAMADKKDIMRTMSPSGIAVYNIPSGCLSKVYGPSPL